MSNTVLLKKKKSLLVFKGLQPMSFLSIGLGEIYWGTIVSSDIFGKMLLFETLTLGYG